MGKLIEIIKCDEEPDAIYYKFGPAREVLIGTAALDRQTGDVLFIGMERDAPMRYVQYAESWHLARRARSLRVKEGTTGAFTYPPTFTCKYGYGESTVTVLEESATDLFVRIEFPREGVALARIERSSGEPTFMSVDAAYAAMVGHIVKVEFGMVSHKLRQHFRRGEFPAETQFCS